MEIFIGNLPNQIKPAELKKIIQYVLFPASFKEMLLRLFNRKNRLLLSEFDVIDKKLDGASMRYAHAVIEPDGVAMRALQRLDHLTYRGCSLRARKYVVRKRDNDRRSKQHKNLYAVNIYNRRLQERRNT